MTILWTSVVAALLILPRQDATLQYRWKQGDVVVYKTTLKTTTKMSGMPTGDVSLEQTMTQRIKLLAAAVAADGAATLQQTTETVSIEMETPGGKVKYDSSDPASVTDDAAVAFGKVFGGMVGSTISITMAPNGAIQRIDGVQRVLEKILRDPPGDPAARAMAQSLRSVLNDAAVRASLEQSFPRLPPQAVKGGDTWTAKIALGTEAVGKVTGTQTLTLKTVDGASAAIDVALALQQESAPPLGPSGMTVTLGDGKGEGRIEFDVALGRIRSSTMNTEMPFTIKTVGPDGRPATLTNTTKTSMTMLLEK